MKKWTYIFGLLAIILTTTWFVVFTFTERRLHLVACDVGQGDAILAFYKNFQILVDGGPDNKVLDCLSKHIPFWDREIEVIVLTHPQKDHYQGLIEVVRRYKVDRFISNGLDSSNEGYQVLKKEVGSRGIEVIPADRGLSLRLDLISLDIVHPSREFMGSQATKQLSYQEANPLAAYTSKEDPNDFSIVAILRLGNFEALLTGDLGPKVSEELAKDNMITTMEYIKVPHHGSRNGLTQNLLEKIKPQIAVISSSKNNSYGHPHKEILQMLSSQGTKILRTDSMGDVEVATDGKAWWLKN